jgi:hypothetical protein
MDLMKAFAPMMEAKATRPAPAAPEPKPVTKEKPRWHKVEGRWVKVGDYLPPEGSEDWALSTPPIAGKICDHCHGKGIYRRHIDPIDAPAEPCYRCNARGTANQRDTHYYDRRVREDLPICPFASA